MLFSSLVFLCLFLPITFISHWLAPSSIRNYVLLFFSLLFYTSGEPIYVVNMVLTITLTFFSARLIDKNHNPRQRFTILTISVVTILALLFYFKYFDFVIRNINYILHKLDVDYAFSTHNLVMPLGISFYSFQTISYMVDVYRNQVQCQKRFHNLALYITLFPHLIAGPIVRYKDIHKEITSRTFDSKNIYYGILRFIEGLAKKVLIANSLGQFADNVFALDSGLDFITVWCAAICYSLQLYFDFSGYSDMAIGLGKMFGFNFLENFNYPYTALSITDFWRRWHISLSSWFRDYVYISLGGNRVGKYRVIFNILVVFMLTGIWHGANWTFFMWGIWHGGFVIFEKIFEKLFIKLPTLFAHIYTMLVVVVGWVIFRADDLGQAFKFLKYLFKFKYDKILGLDMLLNNFQLFMLVLATLISFGVFKDFKLNLTNIYSAIKNSSKPLSTPKPILNPDGSLIVSPMDLAYMILLVLTMIFLVANTFNPFIYFRF